MRTRTRAGLVALLLPVLAAGGCRSQETSSYYVHPNADFSLYQRVAVLPLENLTSDRFAGERVRELLTVELASMGAFDVVELGEVNRVLRAQDVPVVSEVGTEKVRALGEALGVQALMTGSVMAFQERRSGNINAPVVSIALRLIDVESGIAVWSVTGSRTGLSTWTRLFGVGEESQTDASRRLVRDLIGTLY